MDEMTLLEDFRAAVTPPDDLALARARAGMLGGGTPHRGRTGPRGRIALVGLVAAAAAAAVAVAVTVPGGKPAPGGAASPVVKELAYRAAAVAATASAVAPGHWVYWRDKTPDLTYETWTTADATGAAYLAGSKVARMPCIEPAAQPDSSCQSIGQPIATHSSKGNTFSGLYGKMPVAYAHLSSLPRDPVALDRYLADLPLRGWGPAPVREFQVIKDLLITYVMPPALTAELYRALGNIPGVTVDRQATDIAGRHGIGFKIALPADQGAGFDELILNPRTFAVMGQQLTLGPAAGPKAGQIVGGVAILKSALVSGPGIRP